jgi:hypothetical protein
MVTLSLNPRISWEGEAGSMTLLVCHRDLSSVVNKKIRTECHIMTYDKLCAELITYSRSSSFPSSVFSLF